MEDPGTKLSLRLRKSFIITKLQEAGLKTEGTKLQLARRLTQYQEEEATRIWTAISSPKLSQKKGDSNVLLSNNRNLQKNERG